MRGAPDAKEFLKVLWVVRVLKRGGCDMNPLLFALRPNMPSRLQKPRVVERARLDAHEVGLPQYLVKQPCAACWTETAGHVPTGRHSPNPLFEFSA